MKNTKNNNPELNSVNSVEDSHVVKPQGGVTELTTPTGSDREKWLSPEQCKKLNEQNNWELDLPIRMVRVGKKEDPLGEPVEMVGPVDVGGEEKMVRTLIF